MTSLSFFEWLHRFDRHIAKNPGRKGCPLKSLAQLVLDNARLTLDTYILMVASENRDFDHKIAPLNALHMQILAQLQTYCILKTNLTSLFIDVLTVLLAL